MTGDEYLTWTAKLLVHELAKNSLIRQLTKNPDIIGAYAEATVRELVSTVVSPLRVSTGAVIDTDLIPDPKLTQVDAIIWQRCPAPGLLRAENFALVPRSSSFGILEVKRSCYPGAVERAMEVLEKAPSLVNDRVNTEAGMTTTAHSRCAAGLAVFCPQQNDQTISGRLNRLIASGEAVILLREKDDEPNADGVLRLLNYLMHVRRIAKECDGSILARRLLGS
jgi:hypothetical protein